MKYFGIALLLFSLSLVFNAGCGGETVQKTVKKALPPSIDTSGVDLSCLLPFHKRKTFKDYDLPLVEYTNAGINRPDSVRKVIYLLPLGEMDDEVHGILKKEVAYLSAFFQLEVKILPRIPFNDLKKIEKVKTRMVHDYHSAYESKTKGYNPNTLEQIEANSLIAEYIVPYKPKDAVAVLGISDHDLYMKGMNYIYGLSNLRNNTGLISTHRLKENEYTMRDNIRKVVTKQIINIFSIANVKDFYCVSNYTNSVAELESTVLTLSPRALEKLKINIGFDYLKRFKDLEKFHKKERNEEMEGYYANCIETLKSKNPDAKK